MAAASAAPAAAGAAHPVGAAPRVGLLYDERMCAHATPDGKYHPENPERLRAIWKKLGEQGVAERCVIMPAKEAKDKYIASVHSSTHVKLMKSISSKEHNYRRKNLASNYNSIYFNEGSSESAFLAAGSVIEVAEKVAAGELSSAIALVRPPGHHAEHNEPMGFCLFNNVAIAANYLLNERPDLGIKKILIVDWDVHHGNGTQKMFYNDSRVLFFSVHRFDHGAFYPSQGDASHCFIGEGDGQGYNINVPWNHGGCGDADYIAAWDHVLLPVAEAFDPDIILLSAGFDAARGDPLGGCDVTPDGYARLLTKLLGFAKGRMVMALEGGYNTVSIANSVLFCAKVLLGDQFRLKPPKDSPFDSTWNVIKEVRDELKTCWPVLRSKLPKNVPLRSSSSYVEVDGMSIACFGSHDTSPPRGAMWKTVPHRLFFGRSSTPCWGAGGVAFLNPETNYNEKSWICMYKITLEQFNDVLFQENRLVKDDNEGGKAESPDSPLIGLSEIESLSSNKALHLEPIKDSWYSNVLYLGQEDSIPILTMTCPSLDVVRHKAGELPLSPPSDTYSATLIRGLVEGKQLDANEAASYIDAAAARGL
ncbi:histone deacetylase 5 isoform X2 [Brachypodium distachyon]|uniref:histone deacetylase 5 isoform X2 n=1 Tax=Brachypodium distachyon TaxID=15368 RepID=UPI000D0DEAF6|nr:histone deacetylase 5 isoform X2 [Brachypodium distachyon]|eukprot:XP_024312811.1 histone deacetylase 5 isoform X2 [Brachypodium distachyon]